MKRKRCECLECGAIFFSLEDFADHAPTCIPATAHMTLDEIDAAYEAALLKTNWYRVEFPPPKEP